MTKDKRQTALIQAEYQGPLPLPDHFRQYDEILPGAAHRILSLAEQQSAHRQYLEKHVIRGDGRRAWCGLIVGFILAGGCIGGGIWLASTGHEVPGATIATFSVASIVGVFIYGTQSRRAERAQQMPQSARRQ